MDQDFHHFANKKTKEPEDKYGVHFNYNDLYQRLLILQKQRDHKYNHSIFRSFDKTVKKTISVSTKNNHKSKSSIRSSSVAKHSNQIISTDMIKLSRIYSPSTNKKISSPERYLGSIRFPGNGFGIKTLKKRVTRRV